MDETDTLRDRPLHGNAGCFPDWLLLAGQTRRPPSRDRRHFSHRQLGRLRISPTRCRRIAFYIAAIAASYSGRSRSCIA